MELILDGVLSPEELSKIAKLLKCAKWEDGSASAGTQARHMKANLQLTRHTDTEMEIQQLVRSGLARNPNFYSAALPRKLFAPRINRYDNEHPRYGRHIDNALLPISGKHDEYLRADISCTIFLNNPEEYEGGELIFDRGFKQEGVKLCAGDAILYPANTVHEVAPVRSGYRHACFFWIQSFVRHVTQRTMLYNLDKTIMKLRTQLGDSSEAIELVGLYHNLLREWSDA